MTDWHVHTTNCDGKSRAEETVLAAIERGVKILGFSGHGYTAHDGSYCMSLESTEKYVAEIRELREKYKDKIEIRLGVEQDFFGEAMPWAEYRIGSVHYMNFEGEYFDVDGGNDQLLNAANKYFGGDMMCVCEAYFELVGNVYEKTHCDIIGHFDLITKYNERERIIDTENPRYIAAWQAAADKLIPTGVPFEINLGAIFRGMRTTPYPSAEQIKYISSHGGKFILTSDSHSADTVARDFQKWEEWAKSLGAEILKKI